MMSLDYKCKCGDTGSPKCMYHYCKHCCEGCERHPAENHPIPRNVPKFRSIQKKEPVCAMCEKYRPCCIDQNCDNCCQNVVCKTHFTDCKCGIRLSNRTPCCTNSCSGKCCTDSHCNFHFDTNENLKSSDFNDFKVLLYRNTNLPVKLITIIIDEYFDNRPKCCECSFKFDYDIDEYEDDVTTCFECNKWLCRDCSISRTNWDGDFSTYHYCNMCNADSSDDESDETENESDISVLSDE